MSYVLHRKIKNIYSTHREALKYQIYERQQKAVACNVFVIFRVMLAQDTQVLQGLQRVPD